MSEAMNEQISEIINSVVEEKTKEPLTLERLNKEIWDDVDSIFSDLNADDEDYKDKVIDDYFNLMDYSTRTNITIKDFDGSTMLCMISFLSDKLKEADMPVDYYGYGFEKLFNAYAYWIARDYTSLKKCDCDCGCSNLADAGCHGDFMLCDDCRCECLEEEIK